MSEEPSSKQSNDVQHLAELLKNIQQESECMSSDSLAGVTENAKRRCAVDRVAEEFVLLIKVVSPSLSESRVHSPTECSTIATCLLNFNHALREVNLAFPKYRIDERLERAAHCGVPAVETASSLLLLDHSMSRDGLAGALARIDLHARRRLWITWLPYIFDQLLRSHLPPEGSIIAIDVTRSECRKAELAFGSILFSDAEFSKLQDCCDEAASMIDDAMKCGGYQILTRPPGRVRDMVAMFDHRALQWFASDASSERRLIQPPLSIERITAPELRRKLDEVWSATIRLQIALDKWSEWFLELQRNGDAHPAIALMADEMARQAIKVLAVYRPNVEPFQSASGVEIAQMLPPVPAWWKPHARTRTIANQDDMKWTPKFGPRHLC